MKPVSYCTMSARSFSPNEHRQLSENVLGHKICPCHGVPVVYELNIAEKLHEMISESNATPSKVFYYTEKEVMDLCKQASEANLPADTFYIWFDSVKKK